MNFIAKELELRSLPDLYIHADGTPVTRESWETRRAELRELLSNEEYGHAPTGRADNLLDDPTAVTCTVTKTDDNMCAGKVRGEWLRISFPTPTGVFSFPVALFLPQHRIGMPSNRSDRREQVPLVIHLNFTDAVPDDYFPMEEILDHGVAAAQIFYEDVTTDNNDFTNGLAGCYPEMGTTPETRLSTAWGKLRMWAFAASRALDAFLQRDDIAPDKVVIAGHSRLGKTALVAAAYDDRFAGVCCNNSGCSGAAITRDKTGEDVDFITRTFPFWFCPEYRKYANREYEMPFDQHFLTALIAPRPVCIGSAEEDTWADPQREFLTAVMTAGVNRFLAVGSVPREDDLCADNGQTFSAYPTAGTTVRMGCTTAAGGSPVQYHIRPGTHYFSRWDWNRYLAYYVERFFM